MVECGKHDVVSDLTSVADIHPAMVLKMTTGIDKHILAQMNVFAKIRIKRREHPQRRVNRPPEQARQQVAHLLGRMVGAVEGKRNAAGLIAHHVHKTENLFRIKRPALFDVFQKIV